MSSLKVIWDQKEQSKIIETLLIFIAKFMLVKVMMKYDFYIMNTVAFT